MRSGAVLGSLVSVLACLAPALAGTPRLAPPPGAGGQGLDPNPSRDGVLSALFRRGAEPAAGRALPPEALWLEAYRPLVLGDGGGADVLDLEAIQTSHGAAANDNNVLLVWTETTANPPGSVTIRLDGAVVATVDGLPPGDLPGRNMRSVGGLAPGLHAFAVEAMDGTFGETTIQVLAEQPFADIQDPRCEQGPVNADGTCQVIVQWASLPPFPTTYAITLGGVPLTPTSPPPGGLQGFTLADAESGENCFSIRGVLDNTEGTYWGTPVQVCCTVSCQDVPCNPPAGLRLWQAAYGAEAALQALWVNGESTYDAVNGYVNGTLAGMLPGNAGGAIIGPFSAGRHTIAVEGDCGGAGRSSRAEAAIDVRAETPHPTPVVGDIACVFNAAAGSTTAAWTNGAPSAFIDVYLARGGVPESAVFLGSIAGDRTSVGVTDTTAADRLLLQFFTYVAGGCYGSELMSCTAAPPTGNRFIRGLCNGIASDPENPFPGITSAVFLFNFLFLGGPDPPCLEACDVDGQGPDAMPVNLTDGVYLLNFLFLAGPPPAGWIDATGDGVVDPTCETAPEAVCAASHDFCPP